MDDDDDGWATEMGACVQRGVNFKLRPLTHTHRDTCDKRWLSNGSVQWWSFFNFNMMIVFSQSVCVFDLLIDKQLMTTNFPINGIQPSPPSWVQVTQPLWRMDGCLSQIFFFSILFSPKTKKQSLIRYRGHPSLLINDLWIPRSQDQCPIDFGLPNSLCLCAVLIDDCLDKITGLCPFPFSSSSINLGLLLSSQLFDCC